MFRYQTNHVCKEAAVYPSKADFEELGGLTEVDQMREDQSGTVSIWILFQDPRPTRMHDEGVLCNNDVRSIDQPISHDLTSKGYIIRCALEQASQ